MVLLSILFFLCEFGSFFLSKSADLGIGQWRRGQWRRGTSSSMRASLSNWTLYCYHYTSSDGGDDDDGGFSRARSASRANSKFSLSLAGLIAISGLTPTAPFPVVVVQWRGAGGAICEDHFYWLGAFSRYARRRGGAKKPLAKRVSEPSITLAAMLRQGIGDQ